MTYNVQIKVMPLKDLLDPQGKAVLGGLQNLGLHGVENVRVGKHITLQIETTSEPEALQLADEACKKLLANPVMEFYEIEMIRPSDPA
jgi:phosphoribosylformylglycinamidine synthase